MYRTCIFNVLFGLGKAEATLKMIKFRTQSQTGDPHPHRHIKDSEQSSIFSFSLSDSQQSLYFHFHFLILNSLLYFHFHFLILNSLLPNCGQRAKRQPLCIISTPTDNQCLRRTLLSHTSSFSFSLPKSLFHVILLCKLSNYSYTLNYNPKIQKFLIL